MGATDPALSIRFPGGRYAATPWFRSRREHVRNVEWPPSPWRIGRALVAAADRFGDAARVEAAARLVARLATVDPEYSLPAAAPLTYTQWMPTLAFDDGTPEIGRLDNGHYLLDVGTEDELVVGWPGLDLEREERRLLAVLARDLTYLGQSLAVADARAMDAARDMSRGGRAAPYRGDPPAEDEMVVRLLAPADGVSLADLVRDTSDGLLKSLPVPYGARWVDYVAPALAERSSAAPRAGEARVTKVWLRLEGAQRPPVPRPDDPLPPEGRRFSAARLVTGLRRRGNAPWRAMPEFTCELRDEDGDGRAELAVLTPADPTDGHRLLHAPANMAAVVLDEDGRRIADVECKVIIEHVERSIAGGRPDRVETKPPDTAPILWRLRSPTPPLLADAVVVAEATHRAMLSVAGRRFGPDAIPEALSGRVADGSSSRRDHRHKHVLAAGRDGRTVTDLAVWAPGGFTAEERSVVEAIHLPRLAGAPIRLEPSRDHPAFASSATWSSHLPFLPTRHPKRRAGRVVDSVVDQIGRELVDYRGFPAPVDIELIARDWSHVRTLRRVRDRSRPELGAWAARIRFDESVAGPIALGANAHFSMGLFLPEPV